MRRLLLIFLVVLAACRSDGRTPPALSPTTPAATLPATTLAVSEDEPAATVIPTTAPTGTTADVPATLQPAPATAAADTFSVRVHPDGRLYVGDQVSFEVIAPQSGGEQDQSATAKFPTSNGEGTAEARFGPHGIAGRHQAVLLWVWDTAGLPPGEHKVEFSIGSDANSWTEIVSLLPAEELPAAEAQAEWTVAASECCRVSYITGTLADRELEDILDSIDAQAENASARLGITPDKPIRIVLLPRVLGHGGFASNAITVSYLERDYMGGEKARIIHHEMIHILDGQLGGELRPSMLVEGLAVYLSDGHFKAEALLPRAAALLPPETGCVNWSEALPATSADTNAPEGCGLDRFIPLQTLIDNFYRQQHEIGYLEAGALIDFMVTNWGWDAYSAFYRDIQPPKPAATQGGGAPPAQVNNSHSAAVDAALQAHFGIRLSELESRFRQALEDQHVTPQVAEDLRLGLLFYDTARQYQEYLDPSAYFMTAWLLDAEEMRKRDIVADAMRRPSEPENLALETMLVEASTELIGGTGSDGESDYAEAGRLLAAAGAVLEGYPTSGLRSFSADPLALDYLTLVRLAIAMGYEPQQISLENETARMLVSTSEPEMVELSLLHGPDGWTISTVSGSQLPPE